MGNKLKPGRMGPKGGSGTPTEFSNSMAARIEYELNLLLGNEGLNTLDLSDNSRETRDRRMLFVAIARGVVHHLISNTDAFDLEVTGGAGGEDAKVKEILTEGISPSP